jgi:hypothetical protein
MKLARCDECAREAEVDRWRDAPNEWFEVDQDSDDFADRNWLFCSVNCLAVFFAFKRLPEPWEREDETA